MNFYTVKPGDTLARVTLALFGHSRTWQEWARFAEIDPHRLDVGQQIPYPGFWSTRPGYPLSVRHTNYLKFGDVYEYGPWRGKPHPGVDFYEPFGVFDNAPVYAVGEGEIVRRGYDESGYGHYLMMEHRTTDGPVWTLYAHLWAQSSWYKSARLSGRDIELGQQGETGSAGGLPHVHFEVKRTPELGLFPRLTVDNLRDLYLDPYKWLDNPATLLIPVQCWDCPKVAACS